MMAVVAALDFAVSAIDADGSVAQEMDEPVDVLVIPTFTFELYEVFGDGVGRIGIRLFSVAE